MLAATGSTVAAWASQDDAVYTTDGQPGEQAEKMDLAQGVAYETVQIDPQARAHVISVDTTRSGIEIEPYMSEATETTSSAAKETKSLVTINAGFFNLSDGESASYVVVNGKQLCEPKHNAALVNNPGLKPFLTQIFNRSELRIFKDKNDKTQLRIQAHSDSKPKGLKLIHSIQGGPQLLPKYTAREEAFVRRPPGAKKEADSIGTNMRAARTAFGITANGTAKIVCVEGRKTKEFSEGISLPALSEFMRRIGCESAINFDGGTSTTLVLQSLTGDPSAAKTPVSSTPERKVKSMLCVKAGKKL